MQGQAQGLVGGNPIQGGGGVPVPELAELGPIVEGVAAAPIHGNPLNPLKALHPFKLPFNLSSYVLYLH
jgi:hypothetical protein